jgi:hypothetical protein
VHVTWWDLRVLWICRQIGFKFLHFRGPWHWTCLSKLSALATGDFFGFFLSQFKV